MAQRASFRRCQNKAAASTMDFKKCNWFFFALFLMNIFLLLPKKKTSGNVLWVENSLKCNREIIFVVWKRQRIQRYYRRPNQIYRFNFRAITSRLTREKENFMPNCSLILLNNPPKSKQKQLAAKAVRKR